MIVKRQLRNNTYYEARKDHRWGIYTGKLGTLIEGGYMSRQAAEIRKRMLERERGMPKQLPSVGRIVHYVAYGTPGGEYPAGTCRAAIIAQVVDASNVGICIFNPTGLFFATVRQDEEMKVPGTWHWPEYVGEAK